MTEQMVKSQSQRDAAVEMIPIKRINMAEEMARTMAWLINDAPDNNRPSYPSRWWNGESKKLT